MTETQEQKIRDELEELTKRIVQIEKEIDELTDEDLAENKLKPLSDEKWALIFRRNHLINVLNCKKE